MKSLPIRADSSTEGFLERVNSLCTQLSVRELKMSSIEYMVSSIEFVMYT